MRTETAYRRLAAERHPDKPGGSEAMMAELSAARALLKEAVEVVEPFAEFFAGAMAGHTPGYVSESPDDTVMVGRNGSELTFGPFRRARTLIAKLKEATDGR